MLVGSRETIERSTASAAFADNRASAITTRTHDGKQPTVTGALLIGKRHSRARSSLEPTALIKTSLSTQKTFD